MMLFLARLLCQQLSPKSSTRVTEYSMCGKGKFKLTRRHGILGSTPIVEHQGEAPKITSPPLANSVPSL